MMRRSNYSFHSIIWLIVQSPMSNFISSDAQNKISFFLNQVWPPSLCSGHKAYFGGRGGEAISNLFSLRQNPFQNPARFIAPNPSVIHPTFQNSSWTSDPFKNSSKTPNSTAIQPTFQNSSQILVNYKMGPLPSAPDWYKQVSRIQ